MTTERQALLNAQWERSPHVRLRPLVDLLAGDADVLELMLTSGRTDVHIDSVLERMERSIGGLRAGVAR